MDNAGVVLRPAVQDLFQPLRLDRLQAVDCSQEGAADGRVGVRVAASLDRVDDAFFQGVSVEELPQGVSQGDEDPALLAIEVGGGERAASALGLRDPNRYDVVAPAGCRPAGQAHPGQDPRPSLHGGRLRASPSGQAGRIERHARDAG